MPTKKVITVQSIAKPFWSFETDKALLTLQTTVGGLSDEIVASRLAQFGANQLQAPDRFIGLKIFLRQFKSPLIFILIIAGVATLYLREWTDASVIFLAIVVNTLLGFYQENRAEHAIEKLRSYIKERVRVIRNGQEIEIDAIHLVPGDIIHLSSGMRVPADARLIEATSLAVDEALLTGESLPVNKHLEVSSEGAGLPERKNMIFGGTLVVDGTGLAVVTATGLSTEIGKIAKLVAAPKREQAPLQKAVTKLAWLIAAALSFLVFGIFMLGVSRGIPLYEMFLISAAVAVGAIPEALPIALTVVLAVGVEQLAKRNGIVRNLAAAETLGSTTVIMVDKTGTLTEAQMKLVNVISVNDILAHDGISKHRTKVLGHAERSLLAMAYFNTDVAINNPDANPEEWELSGKPLEVNIVRALVRNEILPEELTSSIESRLVLPFNSSNKFSVSRTTQLRGSSVFPKKYQQAWIALGAPDILLEKSNATKEETERIMRVIHKLSADGKRVLGVVAKRRQQKETSITPAEVQKFDFLGLLCFFDPIRVGVREAIEKIEETGVRVVMATGDLPGTARSVASELGWKVNEGNILTSVDLHQLTDEELLTNIDNIKIYSRVTPEDKRRVGLLLKQRGEVVGMTGDGVNDAPSLKAVDIGIAVGSGSDVAKDVADIVLLDDNFLTIAAAIEEGRRTLSNIRKSFVYLMSNSLDSVIVVGGSLLVGLPLPLTGLQIIWVNFFTGSWPALSFAFDEFVDKKMINAQNARTIIDGEVKFLTLGVGVFTSGCIFLLYWLLTYWQYPEAEVRSFIFACFASYILFVAYSFRSLSRPIFSYPVFSNRYLNASVLFGSVLIGTTIYFPPLQAIFQTTSLSLWWILGLAAWVVFNVFIVEVVKAAFKFIRERTRRAAAA